MSAAQHIIEKCGGVAKVAEITGRTESAVYRWTYPKARGGRDGKVPSKAQEMLMEAAARGEIDITAADFFPQFSR